MMKSSSKPLCVRARFLKSTTECWWRPRTTQTCHLSGTPPEFKSCLTRALEDHREVEECKTEMLAEVFSPPTSLAQHLAMMVVAVEVTVVVMEEDTVEDMVEVVEAGPDPGLAVDGEEITTGTPGLTEG